MSEDTRPRQPFEEKAAEAELEGIRRELDESRQRRKQASEAFDAFLRSFGPRAGREPQPISQRLPEQPPPRPRVSEPAVPPPPSPEPSLQLPAPTVPPVTPAPLATPTASPVLPPPSPSTVAPSLPSPQGASGPTPAPADVGHSAAPAASEPGTAPPASESRPAVPGRADSSIPEPTPPLPIVHDDDEFDSLIAEAPKVVNPGASAPPISTAPVVPAGPGALLGAPRWQRSHIALGAVGVAALAAIFLWPRGGDQPEAGREPQPAASATPAPPTPPDAAQAAAAAAGVQIELTTLRRVWLRVIVDGERTVEREVDANQRIPVTAKESIVVRAGDAGALRVSVAGKEETFGAEGLPATRSFTPPR